MSFDLNEEELSDFKKVASRFQIDSEIKKLTEEIETLEVRQDLEGIDLNKEIEGLKIRRDTLSDERNEEFNLEKIKIISLENELRLLKGRISKLKEKKNEISENVYNKLHSEYLEKLVTNESKLEEEKQRIHDLNKKSKSFISKQDEKIEELKVRKVLENIPDESFDNQLDEIKKTSQTAEIIFSATSLILEQIKTL